MDNAMTLEWWHWEIAGLALVLLELAVPAFFIIWFGFGAMLVGLVLLLAPGLTPGSSHSNDMAFLRFSKKVVYVQ